MTRYIVKRILSGIFTIWVTTVAVTLLIHLVPGDPVQIMFAQSQSTTPRADRADSIAIGAGSSNLRAVLHLHG
jgi:ABC-type dipeptide/oligopeptide/nickel transport system permease component